MLHLHGGRREEGAALVISLLMLAVLFILGSGTLTNSRIETQIAENDEKVKQALFAAEYAMSLGEQAVEQARNQIALGFGNTTGRYLNRTQPPWRDLTWDDRDSIDVTTFFVMTPNEPNPDSLPVLPPTLQDANHRPRIILEEKFFKRDSLIIGQGFPKGIWYFNVATHAGRAQWTTTQRSGVANPAVTYDQRYPGTRTVIQSVYAKRYN